MRKRTFIFALLMLLLPTVLAACGGGFDEGEFADAIETAFEDGDFGDYNELVCEADQIDVDEAGGGDASVDCSVDDGIVSCDVEVGGQTLALTGDIDDDDNACDIVVNDGTQTFRLQDMIGGPPDAVPPEATDSTAPTPTMDTTGDVRPTVETEPTVDATAEATEAQ